MIGILWVKVEVLISKRDENKFTLISQMAQLYSLFIVTCCVVHAYQWKSADKISDVQVKDGLVFLKKGEFVLTGDKWILAFDIPFKPYAKMGDHLQETLRDFIVWLDHTVLPYPVKNENAPTKKEGRHFPDPILHQVREEAVYLKEEVVNSMRRLQEIQAIVAIGDNPREKRGLIDAGGKVLKWLFGTVTNEDLERISGRVDQMATHSEQMIHLLREQASIVNITARNVEKNKESIDVLTQIARNLTGEVQALKIQLENTSWSLWRSLVSMSLVQISIRRLTMATLRLQNEISQLNHVLEAAARNRLSPYLVQPDYLFQILQNISLELPVEMALAVPLKKDTTFVYYHWGDVKTAAVKDVLRMFVTIPLKTLERNYELFQIVSLPIPIEHTDLSMIYQTGTEYIAISNDRQSFVEMSREDLERCFPGPFTVCQPQTAIQSRPAFTCAYNTFLGIGHGERCERQILHHVNPYFFRINSLGTWAYSLPQPLQVIVKCPRTDIKGRTSETQNYILNGTGLLSLPAICSAHAKGLTLPSSYVGQFQGRQINQIPITVPDIQMILKASEVQSLVKISADPKFDAIKQKLSKLTQKTLSPVGTSLRELDREIGEIERQDEHNVHMSWFELKTIPAPTATLLLALLIIGGGIFIYRRRCAKKGWTNPYFHGIFLGRREQGRRHTPPILQKVEAEEVELHSVSSDD
jgi:hypothetical protein